MTTLPFKKLQHCFSRLACGIGFEMKMMVAGKFDFLVASGRFSAWRTRSASFGRKYRIPLDPDIQDRASDHPQHVLEERLIKAFGCAEIAA